jgi:uncharacterized protein
MNEVFADAFYWIALANPADQWHSAVKHYDKDNPNTLLVTTEEALTEFLNYYAEAGSYPRRIVGQMCEQVLLHPHITIISQSHESFLQGLELDRQREDKGYSLTDCISMVTCKRRDIKNVLTHDWHFEQEGFTLLL